MNGKRGPVGGNMWSEDNFVSNSIRLEAQESAKHRTDHHGRRPDLVRRTGRERLIVITREHLGDVAERAIERQQSIRPEIGIGRQRTMIAILTPEAQPVKSGQTEP